MSYANDYSAFDGRKYFELYYKDINEPIRFILDTILEVYKSGEICGETLLDIGTGPTIHNLITAYPYFHRIYLSDYNEANRNTLLDWLTQQPDRIDYSHFFTYFGAKDPSIDVASAEDDMRKKIKGILHCDIWKENPLYPSAFPQFDVISTSLCLETSKDRAAYENAAENIASLIKPGGWLVSVGEITAPYYLAGDCKYGSLIIKPEEIKDTWRKLGFTVHFWKQRAIPDDSDIENSEDQSLIIVMAAKKP